MKEAVADFSKSIEQYAAQNRNVVRLKDAVREAIQHSEMEGHFNTSRRIFGAVLCQRFERSTNQSRWRDVLYSISEYLYALAWITPGRLDFSGVSLVLTNADVFLLVDVVDGLGILL